MDEQREAWLGGFAEVSYEAWRAEVDKGRQPGDFDKRLVTRTLEGIAVQPLYQASDWPAQQDAGGFPGVEPFRRGGVAIGRAGIRSDARARYDQPDPELLEREIATDLGRGARSLWLCFDRTARLGSNQVAPPRGPHERGAACLSAEQLGHLLATVPFDRVALSLDAGANALPVAACFLADARERGEALASLRGAFNADPLAALARDGALPCALDSARAQLVALAKWCTAHAPGVRAVTVSSVPHHDAGAHAAQEIGYALATGVEYLRWMTDAGMSIDAACAQIAFSVAIGSDFFMEIGKLRALRDAWSKLVATCGGSEVARRAVVFAVTSLRTKTVRDPWVNMLRETTEAFAAAAGGADAITTCGFDRALGVSDGFARRVSGNLQAILDEEAHVAQVADPAGGAWYVEQLTDQLARSGWALLQSLELAGGMSAALWAGTVATQVATTAKARAEAIAKRKQALTGVSEFAHVSEEPLHRSEPDWESISNARVATLAATNQQDAVIEPLRAARAAGVGMVEAAIEAAAQGASLGQLTAALAGSDEPARIAALPPTRQAEAFEALRDVSDAAARAGQRPRAFLCNLGPIPQHMPRAQFASGFFAAGGFEVATNDGFATAEAAAEAFATSGAAVAVLCGSDDAYPEWVAGLAPRLRAAGAKHVLLAGRARTPELERSYRDAGVDELIFVGSDVPATLGRILSSLTATEHAS